MALQTGCQNSLPSCTLQTQIYATIERHLQQIIDDVIYLQDLMSNPSIAHVIREKFRDYLESLQFLGFEFPS